MESCSLLWPKGWVMEAVPEEQRFSNLVYREHTGRGHEALPDTEFHCDVPGASSSLRLGLDSPTQVGGISFHSVLLGVEGTQSRFTFHLQQYTFSYFHDKARHWFPSAPMKAIWRRNRSLGLLLCEETRARASDSAVFLVFYP